MSLSPEIQELQKAIEAVKKNTVKALASIVQDLVDLTHKGKVEQIIITKYKKRVIAGDPYNQISIRISIPEEAKNKDKKEAKNKDKKISFYLGVNEEREKDLLMEGKKLDTDLAKKFVEINSTLNLLNMVCKNEIPSHVDEKFKDFQSSNDQFFVFSLSRLNLEGNWTEEVAKDWPMLPSYLEPLVNLNGSESKKTLFSKLRRKP